jgi:hypothetical protein
MCSYRHSAGRRVGGSYVLGSVAHMVLGIWFPPHNQVLLAFTLKMTLHM